jgi:hypothetical protein
MLTMLPNRMRALPIDRIFPFNDNDLMIAASDQLVFGLRDIRDETGSVFSIRSIIEARTDIFGSKPFKDRNKEFTNLLFTRLERYFVTQKSDYIYFDLTEQEYLRDKIFKSHALTARVDIFLIDEKKFIPIDFEKLSPREYMPFRKSINEIGAVALSPPGVYVMMNDKSENFDRMNQDRMKKFRADVKMEKIFRKYPGLSGCKSKSEFNSLYRHIAKDLHPDRHGGDHEKFVDFQKDMDYITKKSKWYRGLV